MESNGNTTKRIVKITKWDFNLVPVSEHGLEPIPYHTNRYYVVDEPLFMLAVLKYNIEWELPR